jgi:hypothetical protein
MCLDNCYTALVYGSEAWFEPNLHGRVKASTLVTPFNVRNAEYYMYVVLAVCSGDEAAFWRRSKALTVQTRCSLLISRHIRPDSTRPEGSVIASRSPTCMLAAVCSHDCSYTQVSIVLSGLRELLSALTTTARSHCPCLWHLSSCRELRDFSQGCDEEDDCSLGTHSLSRCLRWQLEKPELGPPLNSIKLLQSLQQGKNQM